MGDTGLVRTGSGAVLQVTDTRPGLEASRSTAPGWCRARPGSTTRSTPRSTPTAGRRSPAATPPPTPSTGRSATCSANARQQGSLVDAGRLRFDFAHFQPVPAERLAEIQAAVNRQLLADPDVRVWHGSLAEAEAAGAISLFGEKYGSVVRVVDVGDFSRELCGGTHVGHGSQVGPVHVLGEASIRANLRRIEALTGLEALHYVDRERQLLAEVAALLKTRPEDAPEQLRRRLEALATAQRELERLRVAGLERQAGELAGRVSKEAGGWLVVERVPEAEPTTCAGSPSRSVTGSGPRPGVVVLGSETQGKAAMVALLTTDLARAAGAGRPSRTCSPGRPRRSAAAPAPRATWPAPAGATRPSSARRSALPGPTRSPYSTGGPGGRKPRPRRTGRQGRRGMTGRVLALDVGTRRLGVAVSDPTGTVASPLATIPRRTPAEDAAALAALAAEHDATTVVVGLPVTLAGSEGPAARAVRAYLEELRPLLGRPGLRAGRRAPVHRGRRAGAGRRRGPAPGPAPGRRPGRGQRLPRRPGSTAAGEPRVSRVGRLRRRRRRRGVLVMGLLLALVGLVVFQALQWSAAGKSPSRPARR